MPAACCWACLTACCWVGWTVICYSLSISWCILHMAKSTVHLAMAAYCPYQRQGGFIYGISELIWVMLHLSCSYPPPACG
jgi:hypothetical protein